MRRDPETILSNVVPQRISIDSLASVNRITRIRSRCGCRDHSKNHPQEHEQASRKHSQILSQKAKSSRGPIRRSL